ncbi:MAG: NfeD family protein [Desulfovibrio sp.]|nr:NfeD family protein [Desulfovibrio sp.]
MNAPMLWFLLGLAFLGTELLAPTQVLLFFGVGAWAAALSALTDFGINIQLVVFIVVSIATLIFLRLRMRTIFGGRSRRTEDNGLSEAEQPHPLQGHTGIVSRNIIPNQVGEVYVGGSFWRAVANISLPKDSPIKVLGALPDDTLTLRVVPYTAQTINNS